MLESLVKKFTSFEFQNLSLYNQYRNTPAFEALFEAYDQVTQEYYTEILKESVEALNLKDFNTDFTQFFTFHYLGTPRPIGRGKTTGIRYDEASSYDDKQQYDTKVDGAVIAIEQFKLYLSLIYDYSSPVLTLDKIIKFTLDWIGGDLDSFVLEFNEGVAIKIKLVYSVESIDFVSVINNYRDFMGLPPPNVLKWEVVSQNAFKKLLKRRAK